MDIVWTLPGLVQEHRWWGRDTGVIPFCPGTQVQDDIWARDDMERAHSSLVEAHVMSTYLPLPVSTQLNPVSPFLSLQPQVTTASVCTGVRAIVHSVHHYYLHDVPH